MTKKEVIWLLIRIAGLWFLWQALEIGFGLVGSLLIAIREPDPLFRLAGVILPTAIRAGLYLAVGIYCLSAGGLFFHLLNRQPNTKEQ